MWRDIPVVDPEWDAVKREWEIASGWPAYRAANGDVMDMQTDEVIRTRGVADGYLVLAAERARQRATPSGHRCVVCRTAPLMLSDGNYVCSTCAFVYADLPAGREGRVISSVVMTWMNEQQRPLPASIRLMRRELNARWPQ